jgi:hypothetical protein
MPSANIMRDTALMMLRRLANAEQVRVLRGLFQIFVERIENPVKVENPVVPGRVPVVLHCSTRFLLLRARPHFHHDPHRAKQPRFHQRIILGPVLPNGEGHPLSGTRLVLE